MSDRWWRAYERSRRDPKLQRLPAETFRGWYNLVCLSSENGGQLPCLADVAYELRKSETVVEKLLADLKGVELFEQNGETWSPRKWNTLQYKSDVSTERVKRFRERSETVSETPSESRSRDRGKEPPSGVPSTDNQTSPPVAARASDPQAARASDTIPIQIKRMS